MRILIHCNGGPSLGVGHVVRSSALVEEAAASGHDVTVAGRLDGDFVRHHLDAAGATVVAFPEQVSLEGFDVIHVDSYDTAVPRRAGALFSNLNDGDFGRRPADICIDPNYGAETVSIDTAAACGVRLLGSRYAPLRRAVTDRRGHWQPREKARRVLVVMGGTDPRQLTPRLLRLLGAVGEPLEVTAVVPPAVSDECAELVRDLGGIKVELVPPVADLPALAVGQDLVISAAGTTVWELCCIGVPMALVCAVDNQRAGYERVLAAGAAVGLGSLEPADAQPVRDALHAVLTDVGARFALAEQASGIVDGRGAWRVVRAWEQLVASPPSTAADAGLTLRAASIADAVTLWRWRNDPGTRAASRSGSEVPLEDHLAWLEKSIAADDRILLVAADPTGDVGTVRWDQQGAYAWEVSITVAPDRRGRSLGGALLRAGERELVEAVGAPVTGIAGVHETNTASRRLFEAAGYVLDLPADADGFLTFVKHLPAGP